MLPDGRTVFAMTQAVARQGTVIGPGSAPWLLMAAVAVVGAQPLLLAPLFVDVARSLDTGPAAIGRAAGAYGLATAVSALALGQRVDRLPRRTVLRGAALGLSAGLLLSAGARHWAWLAAGQAVAGAAAGVLLPVAYATTGELAPADAQTRALGRVLLGWSVAMVVAVPLAAAAGGVVGWRGALAGLAGLALVLVGLLGRLPEPRTTRPAGSARPACSSRPSSRWSPSTAWCRRPPARCGPCWCWPWCGDWSTTSGWACWSGCCPGRAGRRAAR